MKIVSLSAIPEERVSHNPEIVKQVMLRAGDIPHVMSFSRARLRPGQSARGHEHADMYEAFYVESGNGTIAVNGEAFAIEPGTCIVIAPGEHHEISNTGTEELVLVYFGVRG